MCLILRLIPDILFLRIDGHPCQGGTGGFEGVYHLGGGRADTVQRGFQLRQLLVAAPAGDIGKGIVRGVNAEVLADHIGNAFGLHLTGRAVLVRLADDLPVFHGQGVELGMGCLVDQRL